MKDLFMFESEIQLSNGTSFKVYHNLTPHELQSAIDCWTARTNNYDSKSLCGYINTKRLRGLTDHYCYTEKQWKQLNK